MAEVADYRNSIVISSIWDRRVKMLSLLVKVAMSQSSSSMDCVGISNGFVVERVSFTVLGFYF